MFIVTQFLSLFVVVAGNAGALRHLSEDSLDSRDAEAEVSLHQKTDLNTFVPDEAENSIGTTYDSIISMIKPDFLGAVTPNSVSIFGCARADDNDELMSLIDAAELGGEVRLCPGKVEFKNEIVLTKSIIITCAGPEFSCIFDGNRATRHLVSSTSSLTHAFSGIAFINGFSDDSSRRGGSVKFSGATSLFDRCLFLNNHLTSPSPFGFGGAISATAGKTVVNNSVFLGNVAETTSSSLYGGAIDVRNGDLSVLDSTFTENRALSTLGGSGGSGGAISMYASSGTFHLLVAGSVFELNEASDEGGAVAFNERDGHTLKVDWINNNKLIFGNTAGEACGGVRNLISDTCVSVDDNFSV